MNFAFFYFQEVPQSSPTANDDPSIVKATSGTNLESGVSKDEILKLALNKLKESKKSDDESKSLMPEATTREELMPRSKSDRRADIGERNKERERDRDRERERERDRTKSRDRDRGRDSDRERERDDADREKIKDRAHRSKDRGKELG